MVVGRPVGGEVGPHVAAVEEFAQEVRVRLAVVAGGQLAMTLDTDDAGD